MWFEKRLAASHKVGRLMMQTKYSAHAKADRGWGDPTRSGIGGDYVGGESSQCSRPISDLPGRARVMERGNWLQWLRDLRRSNVDSRGACVIRARARRSAIVVLVSAVCLLAPSRPAQATEAPGAPQPHYLLDENSVDMVSGFALFSIDDLSIGGGPRPLVHTTKSQPSSFLGASRFEDNWFGEIRPQINFTQHCPANTSSAVSVSAPGVSDVFCLVSGSHVSVRGVGGALSFSAGVYTYIDRLGVVYRFDDALGRRLSRVRYPNGLQVDINYGSVGSMWRVISVVRNDGFQLHYDYVDANSYQTYASVARVTALNGASEYCGPMQGTCALVQSWRSTTYSFAPQQGGAGVYVITDQAGRTSRFAHNSDGFIVEYRPPSSTGAEVITYDVCRKTAPFNCFVWQPVVIGVTGGVYITDGPGKVITATRAGQSWSYYYQGFTTGQPSTVNWEYSSTNPMGAHRAITALATSDDGASAIIVAHLEDGRQVNYAPNPTANRVIADIRAEGNRSEYAYDTRGNVTQITHVSKVGSGLSSRVVRVGYDTVCANSVTCNQPNWVEDANGNRTDFTYDPVHGGVLTETGPAVNGVRPQVRHGYVQRYAWYLNAQGVQTRAATPIWVLERTSSCSTGAPSGTGCAVAGDDVVTTYDYGPDSGPNNLFLRGQAVAADGQSLRTCYSYNRFGDRISETAPRAGLSACP